jgi:hypothetical protein
VGHMMPPAMRAFKPVALILAPKPPAPRPQGGEGLGVGGFRSRVSIFSPLRGREVHRHGEFQKE